MIVSAASEIGQSLARKHGSCRKDQRAARCFLTLVAANDATKETPSSGKTGIVVSRETTLLARVKAFDGASGNLFHVKQNCAARGRRASALCGDSSLALKMTGGGAGETLFHVKRLCARWGVESLFHVKQTWRDREFIRCFT